MFRALKTLRPLSTSIHRSSRTMKPDAASTLHPAVRALCTEVEASFTPHGKPTPTSTHAVTKTTIVSVTAVPAAADEAPAASTTTTTTTTTTAAREDADAAKWADWAPWSCWHGVVVVPICTPVEAVPSIVKPGRNTNWEDWEPWACWQEERERDRLRRLYNLTAGAGARTLAATASGGACVDSGAREVVEQVDTVAVPPAAETQTDWADWSPWDCWQGVDVQPAPITTTLNMRTTVGRECNWAEWEPWNCWRSTDRVACPRGVVLSGRARTDWAGWSPWSCWLGVEVKRVEGGVLRDVEVGKECDWAEWEPWNCWRVAAGLGPVGVL
jgi:hypothetical protein